MIIIKLQQLVLIYFILTNLIVLLESAGIDAK